MMNLKYKKQLLYCLIIGVAGSIVTNSCKKVDDRLKYVNGLPGIAKIMTMLKTSFSIGDTLQITGKLFAAGGTLQIRIGNTDAPIISQRLDTLPPYYYKREIVDVVRVLITGQMGVGDNIPFSITTNGHTISGPALTIRRYAQSSGRTDTTLWVDRLAVWAPSNPSDYTINGQKLPIYTASSTALNGNLVFSNAFGIFQVGDNGVNPLLEKGKTLTENGQPFTILWFLGSTISPDGKSLYFSAEVNDAVSDSARYYVYRICKMDIAGGAVQTLNRTSLLKIPPPGGFTDQAPYEGDATALKLVALRLKLDYNGDLYFVNYYCSKRASSGSMQGWHNGLLGQDGNSFRSAGMNICQYRPTGQIKSIAKYDGWNPDPPGFAAANTADYLLSPDGIYMYLVNKRNYSTDSYKKTLVQYNLRTEDPELLTNTGSSEYRFYSYDTTAATTIIKSPYQPTGYDFPLPYKFLGNYSITRIGALVLPDGTILCGSDYKSLVAINLTNRTFYLYAGSENGILRKNNDMNTFANIRQIKETGKAKLVDFNAMGIDKVFCGFDSKGAVYYLAGIGPDIYSPASKLSFYKLYSRQ